MPGPSTPTPRAATRVLNVLQALAAEPGGMTLTEMSDAARIPKSSALALARTLADGGFLSALNGIYLIGPETMKLAATIAARRRFPELAAPTVRALAEATGESALLAELAADAPEAVYIHKAESENPLRFIVQIGTREPLYSSAVGRTLLAFKPQPWIEAYLRDTALLPLTASTVTSKKALREMLGKIRGEGVAVSIEETIEGVAGIAAPIFDERHEVVAGLVVGAPVSRVADRIGPIAERVIDAARTISILMGDVGGGHRADVS